MLDHHDGVILEGWAEFRAAEAHLDIDQAPLVAQQIAKVNAENRQRWEAPGIVLPSTETAPVLQSLEATVSEGGLSGVIKTVKGQKRAARHIISELSTAY